MRRSSGRCLGSSVAAAALLVALVSPVAAGEPSRIVVGGGDDPAVTERQSSDDLALNRWKVREAARLRSGFEQPGGGSGDQIQPAFLAPPCDRDCPPVTFALGSWARQQITSYYCGPAAAQVIINRTRNVVSSSTDGRSTTTNYRSQSAIASFMGTGTSGSTAWMVRSGLNQFANLDASGGHVPFTVLDGVGSGSDFHWAMVTATWLLLRSAAVPVQMTLSSQHLASWTSASWWNSHQGYIVRHWISVRGYSGLWDGTYGPILYFTDSAGGYGGATGNFASASRLVFNVNQANSGRIVY